MSYVESAGKCDWCMAVLDDGADVACKKCYEELENKVAELEATIEKLEAQL